MSKRLTKSQYELIAEAFKQAKPRLPRDYKLGEDSERGRTFDIAYSQWAQDTQNVSHMLKDLDEQFDFDKFYELCGY